MSVRILNALKHGIMQSGNRWSNLVHSVSASVTKPWLCKCLLLNSAVLLWSTVSQQVPEVKRVFRASGRVSGTHSFRVELLECEAFHRLLVVLYISMTWFFYLTVFSQPFQCHSANINIYLIAPESYMKLFFLICSFIFSLSSVHVLFQLLVINP